MRLGSLLAFILISISCFSQKQDAEGFTLVFSDPAINIYERWLEFPGKKPAVISREFKSEFTINAPVLKVIDLIRNEAQVKLWQQHLKSYKIYYKRDTTLWNEYSCHDIPWPLSDQDSFLEYRLIEIIPGKEYFVDFKSTVDQKIAPLNDDIHRIELVGSWKFVMMSPGVVQVVYRIQSAPATSLPRMIIDPVVRNNLVSSIKSLTAIAEK